MSQKILVIAEVRGGKLRQVTLEALQAARSVMQSGDQAEAVLLGHNVGEIASALAGAGFARVHVADHPSLETYNPESWLPAILDLVKSVQPAAIFTGHTAVGRDLAPQIAAALGAGQISDVTAIDGGEFVRPIYAGKAFQKKKFASGPVIVTVRPNNFPAAEASGSAGEIVNLDYAAPGNLKAIVKEVVRKASGKVDLTEARIVVSGGRGVKSAEGFKVLEELADVLGAAVGASRGACDAGYCDYALQIGQTGKVVTPELYIACGISGAIQHLAGMSSSKTIVAINKDPEAPIFQVADYGIVGDLFEVVPLLTAEFKKILA
jgi:electron transfer flavoprotein alpha subunit